MPEANDGPAQPRPGAAGFNAENPLSRAFDLRHPTLSTIWKFIQTRPVAGVVYLFAFLIVSTLLLEGSSLLYRRVNTWVDINWAAQWEANDKAVALAKGQELDRINTLHEGRTLRLARPLPYRPVRSLDIIPAQRPSLDDIESHFDSGVVQRPPELLPAGSFVRPIFDGNGDVAKSDGYVFAWVRNSFGLIPADTYESAALPATYAAQGPPVEDENDTTASANEDSYFAKLAADREAVAEETARTEAAERGHGYLAASAVILVWLALMWSYWRAQTPQPGTLATLRKEFARRPVEGADVAVGHRRWLFHNGEWRRLIRLDAMDETLRQKRVVDEPLYVSTRHNAERVLWASALLLAALAACWGWGLNNMLVDVGSYGWHDRLAWTDETAFWIVLIFGLLLLAAGLALNVWELAYQNGWQIIPGAMVLDPEPIRQGREDVNAQKAHGASDTASEDAARAAASKGTRSSGLDDQTF